MCGQRRARGDLRVFRTLRARANSTPPAPRRASARPPSPHFRLSMLFLFRWGEPVRGTGARLIEDFCERSETKNPNEWTVPVRDAFWN